VWLAFRGSCKSRAGKTVGVLLTYINQRRESRLMYKDGVVHIPIISRQLYIMQILETMTQLHTAGILWDEAVRENVLIDQDGDVWLTGFGGLHTSGFVNENKLGTVRSDLQGVARIIQCLSGEEYEPLPDQD
jgi:hypothetical protein